MLLKTPHCYAMKNTSPPHYYKHISAMLLKHLTAILFKTPHCDGIKTSHYYFMKNPSPPLSHNVKNISPPRYEKHLNTPSHYFKHLTTTFLKTPHRHVIKNISPSLPDLRVRTSILGLRGRWFELYKNGTCCFLA